MNFESAFKPKLIYAFRINDEEHKGCLKVGETTYKSDVSNPLDLKPNSRLLNQAAKKRIDEYTSTAGIRYELLHTELALTIRNGKLFTFNDGEVHKILRRSGIKQKFFATNKKSIEWFVASLETVKNAIVAAKEGRTSLTSLEIKDSGNSPIVFRPEQRAAIDLAKKKFAKGNRFLWNAKMRFGKTLSALQLVKEMEFDRTLILTHRPVVDKGWFEDFRKIFYDKKDYRYGSKTKGETFRSLEKMHDKGKTHYVYFASMQDLRGSEVVGGNFDKNNELFSADWSLIIIDEAHEGTKTYLGEAVLNELTKENTKILRLSGTPFNLLDDFEEDEIYTWDYVMEQRAKRDWELTHWGDPNPYACLPKLNIYTYDLSLELKKYQDEEHAFNFKEFFRVGQNGNFIHNADIDRFLNLLVASSNTSKYPYSTSEWRKNFRHSLWTVPGVREAKALKKKLEKHPVFSSFKIVNVAGDGVADSDYESNDALEMVEEAIGRNPDETWTITLSCGRLTTGVSVKAWTAVFMMSGSFSTSAGSYMQTIFRVQTPAEFNGRMKTECFVFDFAPDRTLRVLAETAKISSKAGKTKSDDRQIMGEFLNFCPVISFHGSEMSSIDVPHMMQQLKRVYVERVVRNGFEDGCLYNDNMFQLTEAELTEFVELKKIIGHTKAMPKSGDVDVNRQGFTDEEYEKVEGAEKKKPTELTPEEKALLEKKKEMKKNRDAAISILRGISIRMPMILYGADITDENSGITLDNFTNLVDDRSWEEFMPKGVSKEKFNAFKKYYDEDIFAAAGKRIREMVRAADRMDIEERIERITTIFTSFRNPDKETVLTPWRVVNMHLGDTLGGYTFYNEGATERLNTPRYVDHGKVTQEVFAPDSCVLEINSKSGLYPLYVAYNIYRRRLKEHPLSPTISPDAVERIRTEHLRIWDEVLSKNLFIVCKTPMAKSITRRTLAGFRQAKVNARYFENLINSITNKKEQFIKRISNGKDYWKANNNRNMKFNAVVGNPPYQVMDGGAGSSSKPIYQEFVKLSIEINPKYISLIMPSRWMTGGKGLDEFRQQMLDDHSIINMHDYMDSATCFPSVSIEGGICYFLWKNGYNGKCMFVSHLKNDEKVSSNRFLNEGGTDIVIRNPISITIAQKLLDSNTNNLSTLVLARNPFGIETEKLDEITSETKSENRIFGRFNNVRGFKSLKKSFVVNKNTELVGTWKVFVSKADGAAGQIGNPIPAKIIGDAVIGDKTTICTETFLAICPFKTKLEALNLIRYTKTKFFRCAVGIKKNKNMTRDTYSLVPLQDFTPQSDIDWSKSVAEIDKQLYKKYGLTAEEQAFIEKMIKPME